ncbi:agmatinase [Echinicola pacifica]|uniref:Agmatinase n=1 Tax=Echinicola pacifica TaxID=346377 RepID=A0A918PMF4_9BACT|nr:agmatinase family protein [Echinicola pacifica]GGZ16114.1 agmatinase [Echinicola pacifica]
MSSKKQEIIDVFDPNGVSTNDQLFGLPFGEDTASLVVIPVPWEVTVSYSNGTALGPKAVLKASAQVDLYQPDIVDAWNMGIHLLPFPDELYASNHKYRILAENYIEWLERGKPKEENERFGAVTSLIDKACESMNQYVYKTAKDQLNNGKIVALLGGDHSTPLGLIRALSEKYSSFGVLQIDAHADLREKYEGFKYSHASISYNMLEIPQVEKIVQVGVRDYCEEEAERAEHHKKVKTFYDQQIKEGLYEGKTWRVICDQIVAALPREVYITIDIDGLDPKLCPNTGTPVAGGFELDQVLYLMKLVVKSGRKIIGFDLVEVAPGEDEWDGNVGARILYRMANLMGVSQGKLWWE